VDADVEKFFVKEIHSRSDQNRTFEKNRSNPLEVGVKPDTIFSFMALMTNLPPQAYTRDTLVKAIEWLSSQPPSVRERATTADVIVSFYMQAARKAAAQMEAPVSGENFKADLKHLANDLKKFEEPRTPSYPADIAPPPPATFSRAPSHTVEPLFKPADPPPRFEIVPEPPPMVMPPPPPRQEQKVVSWPVDSRSLAMAKEIKERFNLGNEQEALRMLIVMGAQKVKETFS
jgi:hypothetical protein